ncbi:MAG TPA: hypothetical protein VHB72_04625 [Candidatus Saccharimonadales bacterium]|nr:hypothetical protein [Candidatus Saccharimonadales bacterium]
MMRLKDPAAETYKIIIETEADRKIILNALGAARAPFHERLVLNLIDFPYPLDVEYSDMAMQGLTGIFLGDHNYSECGFGGLRQEQAGQILGKLYGLPDSDYAALGGE